VTTAAGLGFDLMIAGQHYLGDSLRYLQPIPYLAHLSGAAPSMRVATGIMLLSLANPVDLAEQAATLDVVTGGRLTLGVGLGYSPHEFAAFGVKKGTKVARFEEALALVTALWTGAEVDFEGQFWQVKGGRTSVLPIQQPRPPIWLGGQVETAVRRAARLTDAWYAPPFPSHDQLLQLRKIFLDTREELGLTTDGEFPVRRELILAPSKAQALRLARERSANRYSTYARWGLSGQNTSASDLASGAEQDIREHFVLGSPAECVDQLGELRDRTGMTHFVYKCNWPGLPHHEAMKQLETFGNQVLPQLA
jgi:alkanesulfonate monooxygenase SsuD/methylene tetrahydromethanopterin reductase-like flavin-dependent oxidoreductase (luciferase family)